MAAQLRAHSLAFLRIEHEIWELHQFFQDWFTGGLENTDENFIRLEGVLADGFHMIAPNGRIHERDDLLKGLRKYQGTRPKLRIWIEDVRLLRWMDALALVSYRRRGYEVQEMLANSVQGHDYYSDDYDAYKTALYSPAIHYPMKDKSETYAVEGDNADLRHYLARLRRKSRCFSRCEHALRDAVKLFVFAYNQRQLFKQRFPNYTPPLMDFATPCY